MNGSKIQSPDMGIGGQTLKHWFQKMVKFYAFLKKSTEFISMSNFVKRYGT